MRGKFSLDYILTRGVRLYDIISIISLSAGINILTSIAFEPRANSPAFGFYSGFVSGALFVVSGIGFSWLSYWTRIYLEVFSKDNLIDAVQKIRSENKEKEFKRHFIFSWIFFVIAILYALAMRLCLS